MKGSKSALGDERLSPNGYVYIKTKDGWRLKHHVIAEEHHGRKVDKDVTVRFKDGDRTNFDPSNIVMQKRYANSKAKRVQILRQRIRELQAELTVLLASDEE